jgi:hypothetical protein
VRQTLDRVGHVVVQPVLGHLHSSKPIREHPQLEEPRNIPSPSSQPFFSTSPLCHVASPSKSSQVVLWDVHFDVSCWKELYSCFNYSPRCFLSVNHLRWLKFGIYLMTNFPHFGFFHRILFGFPSWHPLDLHLSPVLGESESCHFLLSPLASQR